MASPRTDSRAPRLPALAALLTSAIVAGACANAPAVDADPWPSDAEMLIAAMGSLTDVIVYDIFSPPQASRAYAYASVAAYETLRHDHPDYVTLAGQVNDLPPVPAPPDGVHHLPLAAVHAFMTVGRALTFSHERMDSARSALHAGVRGIGLTDDVFDRSIAYGEAVAQHILAWAGRDNYVATRSYPKFTVTADPGRWVPTPPAYMDAVEPHWAAIRPFVIPSADAYRPPPPVAFDTTPGSDFFRQVEEVYRTGVELTPEQRAIAAFWDCNPYVMHVQGHAMFATKKITPGGHWMGIVGLTSREAGADMMRTAAAYARTAIAVADGFISAWEAKYAYELVRPETVINATIDEEWQPLLQTPPFPEYTSAHSVISNAAAAVLTDEFGAPFALVDSTEVPFGLPPRAYTSFTQAAEEAAISRMYGGIHYRMAIESGIEPGRRVGEEVVRRVRVRAPGVIANADAAPTSAGQIDH